MNKIAYTFIKLYKPAIIMYIIYFNVCIHQFIKKRAELYNILSVLKKCVIFEIAFYRPNLFISTIIKLFLYVCDYVCMFVTNRFQNNSIKLNDLWPKVTLCSRECLGLLGFVI